MNGTRYVIIAVVLMMMTVFLGLVDCDLGLCFKLSFILQDGGYVRHSRAGKDV